MLEGLRDFKGLERRSTIWTLDKIKKLISYLGARAIDIHDARISLFFFFFYQSYMTICIFLFLQKSLRFQIDFHCFIRITTTETNE